LQAIGEFLLTQRNLKIPARGKIYSLNEGYEANWDEPTKEYIKSKKYPPVSGYFIDNLMLC
jgi:fructose-1,6-bisphosphatase I